MLRSGSDRIRSVPKGEDEEDESGGQLLTVCHQNACRETREEQRAKQDGRGRGGTSERDEGEVSNISSEVVATSTRNIYTSVRNIRSVVKG